MDMGNAGNDRGSSEMKHRTLAILGVCHLLYVGTGRAHHSIDADFTPGVTVTINAVVTDFRFINPHPYVTAKGLDSEGEAKEWLLMLDDRWEMVEAGFTRSTFQAGDELVVTGRPSRREPGTLYVRVMERPSRRHDWRRTCAPNIVSAFWNAAKNGFPGLSPILTRDS